MIFLLIAAISIFISLHDLRTHRIPNRATLTLFVLLLLPPHNSHLTLALLLLPVILGAMYLMRFGMGDLKLVLVVLLTSFEIVTTPLYFWLSIKITIATVVAHFVRGSRQTAFAHIVLIPFLLSYLAF